MSDQSIPAVTHPVPMTRWQERGLLAVLSSVQFSHIVDFVLIMPLGPQLMRLFAITPTEFGIVVSAYSFADRNSRKYSTTLTIAVGQLQMFWRTLRNTLTMPNATAAASSRFTRAGPRAVR